MNPKTILIIDVDNVGSVKDLRLPLTVKSNHQTQVIPDKTLFRSSIVVLRDKTHFRPIKNRWGDTSVKETIPNFLLRPYLSEYVKNLTGESLLDLFLEENSL